MNRRGDLVGMGFEDEAAPVEKLARPRAGSPGGPTSRSSRATDGAALTMWRVVRCPGPHPAVFEQIGDVAARRSVRTGGEGAAARRSHRVGAR